MDGILRSLGGLLLKAIPTFLLVVTLTFYLKRMFFKPLARVLEARYQATEGARKLAEESLQKAAAKAAEYEEAMRRARADIYQAQEQSHRSLAEERERQVRAAREQADAVAEQARQQLSADVEEAKKTLAGESEMLAGRIADVILSGRPA
jgi:F-type H+-transporting ATPase subunit b